MLVVEMNVDVLPEPRRVIVAERLGVAESFQHGVALEHLLLRIGCHSRVMRHRRQVLHHELGALRLA
jgi:hypothetical protein